MYFILLLLLSFFAALPVAAQQTREIFLADVTIYAEGGKYYLTGSKGTAEGPAGFALLESTDLKTWRVPAKARDSQGMILTRGDHTFGTKGFWAPQVVKAAGTYYLTYTADEQTALAQAPALLGPYRQPEVGPVDGSAKNIDSYLFKDEDGKYYLYHVRFNHGNYLWVAEFDLLKGKLRPETLQQCFPQTQPWEATPAYKSVPIMEGPTVVKMRGKYYLFYSANHFESIDYAVGYAVADSPYGPWLKQADNPFLHRSIVGENGSGHGDLLEGVDGQLYYVYHVHFSLEQVSPRRTRIVPVTKAWDAKTGLYRFRVAKEKVIVPVMAVK